MNIKIRLLSALLLTVLSVLLGFILFGLGCIVGISHGEYFACGGMLYLCAGIFVMNVVVFEMID